MVSPICRETGLEITRSIELSDTATIALEQTITNRSESEVVRGIWDVTQVRRPFEVQVPIERAGVRAYPEEGDSVALRDKVVTICESDKDWTCISCFKPEKFKYGGVAKTGEIKALRQTSSGTVIFARRFDTDPEADFAHDASVEVYNSAEYDYLEIEIHGPLARLQPGESASHRQVWTVER